MGALFHGFETALSLQNIAVALIGVILGTIVGVLPGIGPVAAMALLLPLTMKMATLPAIILLAGLYYGSQYGDSMAAILVNVPSEAPAIVIAREGYPMTRAGRGGAALAIAGVASFIGATVGLIGISVLALPLSQVATYLRPPDFAAIALLGLLLLPRVGGTEPFRGLVAIGIGLAIGTIGLDPIASTPRFTFGYLQLTQGVELVPVAVGLFGLAQVIHQIIDGEDWGNPGTVKLRDLNPSRQEWRRAIPASGRGSILGFLLGAVPGPSLILSTFSSYALERRLGQRSGNFGKGAVEGVAGPKAADDSAVGGNLIPILILGVAFTPVTAILLSGLRLHSIEPGPLLIQDHPNLFWGLLAAMYLGNVALLVLNFPMAGLWVHLLRIKPAIRSAGLVVIMIVGVYSVRYSVFDVGVMVLIGFLGYALRRAKVDCSLLVLGLVLGPFLEDSIRRSLQLSAGNMGIFVSRPVGQVTICIIAIVWIILPIARALRVRAVSFSRSNSD